MTDVSEVLAGLDSGLRKQLVLGDAVSIDMLALPSIGLTQALGGGFPYGRQVLIYGSKSSAKSSFCLEMVGLAQREGKVCAWIDSEMSYDSSWAERLGVDTHSLIVSQARTVNEMVDVSTQLMSAGVDVIVIDSISSMLPAVYFKKNSEDMKALEDTGRIGSEAQDFSRAMKMINYANNRKKPTLIVLISQTRSHISMFTSQQPTGGQAVKFYSSVIVKLFSSEATGSAITRSTKIGNKSFEEPIGRKVDWLVQFSKTSPAFASGDYEFFFKGDTIGINREGELVDVCVRKGLIEVSSSWFTIGDTQLHGRAKAIDHLRLHPEIVEELTEMAVHA